MFKLNKQFILIAGPCVIESEELCLYIAKEIKRVLRDLPIQFIFKASYDKANRTSLNSYRGPGLEKGLEILNKVKKDLKIPILSDVHCVEQVEEAKKVLDIIQIPAFLSRQTDLIVKVAKTGKYVNVKKAQFMAPEDMVYVVEKITSVGNRNILLTERGTFFGYHNLVVDFRSISIMKKIGYPVIFDITHSLQRPSSEKGVSGGDIEYVDKFALASVCFGVDGLFMEVHPNPQEALSDKNTSLKLDLVEGIIKRILKVKEVL